MGSVIWTRRGGTGAGAGWGVAWNVAPHSALMEEAEGGKGGGEAKMCRRHRRADDRRHTFPGKEEEK